MKVLVDTSAYSELKRGHPGIADLVRNAEAIVFSPIVVGELLFGFRRSRRAEHNVRELHEFLESPFVSLVPVSIVTADRFSRIALALRAKGRPIPTNDIWIAAQALETGADLLSFDEHFAEIDGVAWVRPG